MVQHSLLGLAVPLLLVLSAPLTLALQIGGTGDPRRRCGPRCAAGRPTSLAHPVVAWCLFGGGLVAIYLTPLLGAVRAQRRRPPGCARPRGGVGHAVPGRARRGRPAAGPAAPRAPGCWPCWWRCRSTRWWAWRCCRPGRRSPPTPTPAVRPAHRGRPVLGDGRAVHPGRGGASSSASGGWPSSGPRPVRTPPWPGPRRIRPPKWRGNRFRNSRARRCVPHPEPWPHPRCGGTHCLGFGGGAAAQVPGSRVLTRFMAASTPSDRMSSTASAASLHRRRPARRGRACRPA